MIDLEAIGITVEQDGKALVDNASLTLPAGSLTALLGPNGAGKTSLLQVLTGLRHPSSGTVSLDGQPLSRLTAIERARKIAYLPQTRAVVWPVKVREVVALGRFAHGIVTGRLSGEDALAVDRALNACDLDALANRSCDSLSGGELARVHCARAFAADAPLLIADEPTSALDPRHAFDIMTLVQAFVRAGGSALVVLHDIALAARYADQLLWMQHGRIVSQGSVTDTLTPARLADVFGVSAQVDGRKVTLQGATELGAGS